LKCYQEGPALDIKIIHDSLLVYLLDVLNSYILLILKLFLSDAMIVYYFFLDKKEIEL